MATGAQLPWGGHRGPFFFMISLVELLECFRLGITLVKIKTKNTRNQKGKQSQLFPGKSKLFKKGKNTKCTQLWVRLHKALAVFASQSYPAPTCCVLWTWTPPGPSPLRLLASGWVCSPGESQQVMGRERGGWVGGVRFPGSGPIRSSQAGCMPLTNGCSYCQIALCTQQSVPWFFGAQEW